MGISRSPSPASPAASQARIKKLEEGARLEQEDRISREKNRKMQAEEADRLELENSLVRRDGLIWFITMAFPWVCCGWELDLL